MQYIDNDMDELFNKAGRDYPLKTDNGDWDAIAGRLQQPAATATPLTPKNNRKYYWLLLFLLLPIDYLMFDNDAGRKSINQNDIKSHNANSTTVNHGTNDGTQAQSPEPVLKPVTQKNTGNKKETESATQNEITSQRPLAMDIIQSSMRENRHPVAAQASGGRHWNLSPVSVAYPL